MMGLPKAYRRGARFGAVSDTGDPTGGFGDRTSRLLKTDVRRGAAAADRRDRAARAAYSAVKVGGERLYRKARRGEAVRDAVREVSWSSRSR